MNAMHSEPGDELLIAVDAADNVLAYRTKRELHAGAGVLHRAFSIFLFNARGEVLVQQRSRLKPLWPGFWSNSCCSHPRRGENDLDAARRRLTEELGVRSEPEFLYRFEYHAAFDALGSEHELCSVYLARSAAPPRVDPDEVAAWKWMACAVLDRELAAQPERFTPWLKLEWPRLRTEFAGRVADFAVPQR